VPVYHHMLQRGRELESNFRVNLIWVGRVNFNLGGFFYLDWVNFFLDWVVFKWVCHVIS
jgi:hypothetical protein